MTKVDIFSGFLGAGKTTLIKKLIAEAYAGEKLVLIENEFGQVGIDGGFMKDAGIEVTEMNQGCICCSLVGDFAEALKKVLDTYAPDRILIEPSGVGKLSDVIRAVQGVQNAALKLNTFTAVVDAKKCEMYMKNFGEFYNDQVENASCIVLSRTQNMDAQKLDHCVSLLRARNATASIVTTDWNAIDGKRILQAMERTNTLQAELSRLAQCVQEEEARACGHHHHDDEHECGCGHHHHDDEHECGCGHHHHDDEHECGCGHHHHHDDEHECGCGHHHHHDDEHECGCGHHHHDDEHECGCGHHHHHHGHDADEVFVSYGAETTRAYTAQELRDALSALADASRFGMVLRAKGIVAGQDGAWLHFDYVPGESDVRSGAADITGRICVIGSQLREDAIAEVFNL